MTLEEWGYIVKYQDDQTAVIHKMAYTRRDLALSLLKDCKRQLGQYATMEMIPLYSLASAGICGIL